MNQRDLDWLSGMLEGEGSFGLRTRSSAPKWRGTPTIAMSSTDRDVIQRVAKLIGSKSITTVGPRQQGHKTSYQIAVTGQKAADLMLELRPLMGDRRGKKIDAVLSEWTSKEGETQSNKRIGWAAGREVMRLRRATKEEKTA